MKCLICGTQTRSLGQTDVNCRECNAPMVVNSEVLTLDEMKDILQDEGQKRFDAE